MLMLILLCTVGTQIPQCVIAHAWHACLSRARVPCLVFAHGAGNRTTTVQSTPYGVAHPRGEMGQGINRITLTNGHLSDV